MNTNKLHRYGAGANGSHAVGIDLSEGIRVLVTPTGPEHDGDAVAVAKSIVDASSIRTELEIARMDLELCRANLSEAREALKCALSGRRRFFGRALMVPALAGDWTGAIWLYDPAKRERGMGLRFKSLRDVRETYPELWVAGTAEGGVLLDAAPILSPKEAPNG